MSHDSSGGRPGQRGGPTAAIVDDDALMLDMIGTMLGAEGFQVERFRDGQSAYEGFQRAQPDIAIVDLVMPRMDGMELVRRVREQWDFPVIMITGGKDDVDEALGLRLGADDYVHKPFAIRLLMERINAQLRRVARQAPSPAPTEPGERIITRGPLHIDPERREVTWQGKAVTLTVTEFEILCALARRPGVVKSRDQLLDAAYKDQVYVDDRTIDSHIKRLRRKFRGADPNFTAIETLYGVGYRFDDHGGEAKLDGTAARPE